MVQQIDLTQPKYNQNTYIGRSKHFFRVTNPLNLLVPSKQLEEAKQLIQDYSEGRLTDVNEKQLWRSKYLMDSAFHPETGEKMNLLGRMSAQVPCNMIITGCMMTWYKTNLAIFGWQWLNQSFNALVNYTNRSGTKIMTNQEILQSYFVATAAATITALTFKSAITKFPPIVARFVPYTAVAAANCINIPFMRYGEVQNGIPVFDEQGRMVGQSSNAAKRAIFMVVVSRIFMCTPGMIIPPFLMESWEKKRFLRRFPAMNMPIQAALVGIFLTFMTPLGCALFPQRASIRVSQLEANEKMRVMEKYGLSADDKIYFNKGL
ncbi:hypothetical protein GJ496_004307 [Pomphorhynchus laevis]|nr:hypothetical protein GJ496_004307 [Pomphorhynchus laevis]